MESVVQLAIKAVPSLVQMDNVADTLGMGLSLLPLSESSIEGIITAMKGRDFEVDKKFSEINKKLDLLLRSKEQSFCQHMQEAQRLFHFGKRSQSAEESKQARDAAAEAFNLAGEIRSWVSCTQYRIFGCFMALRFEEGETREFPKLTSREQERIATTIQDYVDELCVKVDKQKTWEMTEASNAMLGSGSAKIKLARKNYTKYDQEVNRVLGNVYMIMSEGLNWTALKKRIPMTAESYTFNVLPKYVPIGESAALHLRVCENPEIVVLLFREIRYSLQKRKEETVEEVKLVWIIGTESFSAIMPGVNVQNEPYSITIRKEKLDQFRRGGIQVDKDRRISMITPNQQPSLSNRSWPQPSASTSALAEMASPSIAAIYRNEAIAEMSKDLCSLCQKPLGEDRIEALGGKYHNDCFHCSKCGTNLSGDDDPFKSDPSKNIYCVPCFNKEFGKRCQGCQEMINVVAKTAPAIVVQNKTYHPECFRCANCKAKLGPGGETPFPKGDNIVCRACRK